jgi:hypothetical protein
MSKIVANARYLCRQIPAWIKWFTIISYSIVFIVVSFAFGPFVAVVAVIGVTIVMVGILPIGFLRYNKTLWFFIAIGAICIVIYVLDCFHFSPEVAGIVATCLIGWGYILYSLASYTPPL